MYAGRIVEQGSAAAVLGAPRHPYTRGLLDSVPSNHPRGGRLAQIPGMLEENFVTSMIKSDDNLLGFFSRPIAAALGALTLAAWFLPPVIRRLRRLAGA